MFIGFFGLLLPLPFEEFLHTAREKIKAGKKNHFAMRNNNKRLLNWTDTDEDEKRELLGVLRNFE